MIYIFSFFFSDEINGLEQIIEAVLQGQTKRAPIERIVDVVTTYFVPVVTALAILTWIIWLSLGLIGISLTDTLANTVGGWRRVRLFVNSRRNNHLTTINCSNVVLEIAISASGKSSSLVTIFAVERLLRCFCDTSRACRNFRVETDGCLGIQWDRIHGIFLSPQLFCDLKF